MLVDNYSSKIIQTMNHSTCGKPIKNHPMNLTIGGSMYIIPNRGPIKSNAAPQTGAFQGQELPVDPQLWRVHVMSWRASRE